MRIKKLISNTLSSLMLIIFILLVVAVVLSKASGGEPTFFGYQIKSVLSGSMEPGIHTGSIVALKPGGDLNRFKEGDVITFRNEENLLITHRIVEATLNSSTGEATYRTKGDNNDAPDLSPVLSNNVVAQYTGVTVPYVGYAMNFAASKAGSVVLLIIPGVLLLFYALYSTWKALTALEKKNSAVLAASPPPTETPQ